MDEDFCQQCFCTEKHEKCVRPDKNLSIKAAPQGRENKKKRLLYRNRAIGPPSNYETRQPRVMVSGTCVDKSGVSLSIRRKDMRRGIPFITRLTDIKKEITICHQHHQVEAVESFESI